MPIVVKISGGGAGAGGGGGWGSGGDKGGWGGGGKGGWDGGKSGKGGWGGGGGWDSGGKGKGKGKDGKDGKDGKGKGGGKASMKQAQGETVYTGRVKMYNAEKTHGYIVSEHVYSECGQDVYAFKDVLERSLAGPGDLVVFFVHWSAKGQPQGSSPMLRLSVGDGEDPTQFALKGTFKPGKDPTSFGFIENDETKDFFGRDVYCNKDLASALQPGQSVAFNCYMNKDGMPNVKTLELIDDSWEPTPADLSETREAENVQSIGKGGKDKGKGKDKGWGGGWDQGWGGDKGGWGGGKGKSKGGGGGGGGGQRPVSTGRSCSGFIKSFSEKNNYGFIECEDLKAEFGADVFAHGMELTKVKTGDAVFFELAMNSKNQPQALNVQSADAVLAGEPAPKRTKTEGAAEADPFTAAMEEAFGAWE